MLVFTRHRTGTQTNTLWWDSTHHGKNEAILLDCWGTSTSQSSRTPLCRVYSEERDPCSSTNGPTSSRLSHTFTTIFAYRSSLCRLSHSQGLEGACYEDTKAESVYSCAPLPQQYISSHSATAEQRVFGVLPALCTTTGYCTHPVL